MQDGTLGKSCHSLENTKEKPIVGMHKFDGLKRYNLLKIMKTARNIKY